jgi:hypothetical protein
VDARDAAFLAAFEDGTLPKEQFPHREHLRVAWLYLSAHGFVDGSLRVAAGIRHFAAVHDVPGLYHETVTRAWLRVVEHARAQGPPAASFAAFLAANPQLAVRGVLERYYEPATLQSAEARAAFVPPDREPLP